MQLMLILSLNTPPQAQLEVSLFSISVLYLGSLEEFVSWMMLLDQFGHALLNPSDEPVYSLLLISLLLSSTTLVPFDLSVLPLRHHLRLPSRSFGIFMVWLI